MLDGDWSSDVCSSDLEDRRKFHLACEGELVRRGVKFVRVRGTIDQRRAIAIEAIDDLLRMHR
jgi:nicotinamide riboside kinase